MIDQTLYNLFRGGSKTYFYSSVFFPKRIKADVFALYAFVRKADNFVDVIPQLGSELESFAADYARAEDGQESSDVVIRSFVELRQRRGFDRSWVDAFLDAMRMDLSVSSYPTVGDVERYIYGSAEVVGLMMASILGLPEESHPAARSLGKAMQYINFIRDIPEDLTLGRTYLPLDEMKRFGLGSLSEEEARSQPDQFAAFLAEQIHRYLQWQKDAEDGFRFIPKRYLIPVKTASEMYKWTARRLKADPLVMYRRKVKPSVARIVWQAGYNSVTL